MKQFFCRNGTSLRYDSARDIWRMSFPVRPARQEFFLDTLQGLREHFDDVVAIIRGLARPKADLIIDYTNFDINPELAAEYRAGVEQVLPYTGAIVRVHCNILQASMLRAHEPSLRVGSQLCSSHDEALRLLHTLRRGRARGVAQA